jgi:hypothetical protein
MSVPSVFAMRHVRALPIRYVRPIAHCGELPILLHASRLMGRTGSHR